MNESTNSSVGCGALIVIEERELFRHCVISWLASAWPEIKAIGLSSLSNAEANAAISCAALIILRAGAGPAHDSVLKAEIRLIRTMRDDIPVALIGGPSGEATEEFNRELDVAGYIPMTSTSEVAVAALRLMLAGGRYIPYEMDANLSNRPFTDLSAISGEMEALLTPRERAVMNDLRRGLPNKLIAHNLGISIGTVKMHVHNIMSKLKVRNRTEAAIGTAELDGSAKASVAGDPHARRRSIGLRQAACEIAWLKRS